MLLQAARLIIPLWLKASIASVIALIHVCDLGAYEYEEDHLNDSSNVDDSTTSEVVTFSAEEEKLYSRRFENGYDLYDPRYNQWLGIHHPIAASVRSNGQIADLISSPIVTPVHVESPPLNVDGSTNTADHAIVEHPQTNSTDKMASSSSVTHESTVKRSPLAELVNIPRINRDNRLKTGHARVLTSSECIKAFEEKEERKRAAEEEKQKRKAEREIKKRQREEEMQRKKEEKAQKAATKEAKQREKSAMQASKQQSKQPTTKRKPENNLTSRAKRSKTKDSADDEIDCNRCCTCFGLFSNDLGTEREWLRCKCGRWIHEDCVDEDDVNSEATKLCPLC